MEGTCDRVIANNSDRYGVSPGNTTIYVRPQPEASQQLLNTANPLIKSFERK